MSADIETGNVPTPDELLPYVANIHEATQNAENEEQLKFGIENILRELCHINNIFWNPYTYEHSFKSGKR